MVIVQWVTEYLEVSDDLAHGRSSVPVLCYAPDYVGHYADHGNQQVYSRQQPLNESSLVMVTIIYIHQYNW